MIGSLKFTWYQSIDTGRVGKSKMFDISGTREFLVVHSNCLTKVMQDSCIAGITRVIE